MDPKILNLKSKISQTLNNLNKSSKVFDDMINDYNALYKKYMNIQKLPEQNQRNQRLNTIQFFSKPEETPLKVDQTELEKKYKLMEEQYFKLKNINEQNIETINKNVQQIMELKNKIEIKDKKINGYSAENSALKQQNLLLDKKNKELNEINNRNEKYIFEITKYNQKLEIDHKKLIDNAGKMHMEIDKLRTKLLEMQEHTMSKVSQYNEIIEKNQLTSSKFHEKSETFIEQNRINLDSEMPEDNEIKIPDKLIYKQKLHYKNITSINFNKLGTSYVTTGEDNLIHIFDAGKNLEIFEFSFSDVVSDASFDNNENFLFSSSFDKTAKLFSLKSYKLSYSFTGHTDKILCAKSLNTVEHGITGGLDKTIIEWDFNSKNLIRKFDCGSECHSLAVEQEDKYILTGHLDGKIRLWGINDKTEKIFNLHGGRVVDIKQVKGEKFLTLGTDSTINLFDLRKEQVIYTINSNVISECCESSIGISPDKKYFAVGGNEGTIFIFNYNDGSINTSYSNNRRNCPVTSLGWRPNTSKLYVGDSNGFLSIWDANNLNA